MNILVIGSFMMDFVVRSARAPVEGETIIGESYSRFLGGKGANQAVSAVRLGGQVTMVGKLGCDDFGDEFMDALKKENINSNFVLRDLNSSTGIGSITIDNKGNNRIVVIPGANLTYTTRDLGAIENVIKSANLLILQLEMDIDMINAAVYLANFYHVPIILNPAPARELTDHLLSKITYLTPNETEAEILTGIKIKNVEDIDQATTILLEKGVKNVIMTLGDKGAYIKNVHGSQIVKGYSVKPIDTVAAGDAFNGALAAGLMEGKELVNAVKFANAVGALTVTTAGAIPSIPRLSEVERFIKEREEKCM